ncbi:MAG TPA: hypothetical protein VNH64_11895 [Parvularculaceae bacterium]|nr:hypothetical protein [Parvularculaceae bacterium]
MAAFRFLAWLLVSIAVALLGADAVSSLEQHQPVIRTTAEILSLIGFNNAGLVQNSPHGIAKALQTILALPLWAILGLIGVVLTLVFRPIE